MGYKIVDVEGIGPAYAEKLSKAGVKTTTQLLKLAATPAGRKNLAKESGLSEKLILNWTNKADLMRISGVGPQFSELLEAAGVDTVKELRTRNAGNLAEAMKATNEKKKLTRVSPPSSTVEKWVEAAKKLDATITY